MRLLTLCLLGLLLFPAAGCFRPYSPPLRSDWTAAELPPTPAFVTLPRGGGPLFVPSPPLPPAGFFKSEGWRFFASHGNVMTVAWADASGRRWEVDTLSIGERTEAPGSGVPDLLGIREFDEEGRLVGMAESVFRNRVEQWTHFAGEDGTGEIRVFSGGTVMGAIRRVEYIGTGGEADRIYEVDDEGVAVAEWTRLDGEKRRVRHEVG